MIQVANKGCLLFLAVEIMGGTNSHDRRIATEWGPRALMLRGAIGGTSTHDLALTEIASNGLPGRNVYFENSGDGDDARKRISGSLAKAPTGGTGSADNYFAPR